MLSKLGDDRSNRIEAIAQLVNRMYERRIELGWTQQYLAEKAGCRQEQIARIENGATMPRIDTVVEIAQALGLHLHFQGMEEAAAYSMADQKQKNREYVDPAAG